jgi:hypothetical protein
VHSEQVVQYLESSPCRWRSFAGTEEGARVSGNLEEGSPPAELVQVYVYHGYRP